jgi:hypothetical protein
MRGTREGIRTPDLRYRKPTLYPAELRAHITLTVMYNLGLFAFAEAGIEHFHSHLCGKPRQPELRAHIKRSLERQIIIPYVRILRVQ